MKIPLVSDTRRTISTDYGVLKEDEGIAYRWGFSSAWAITRFPLRAEIDFTAVACCLISCSLSPVLNRGLFIIDPKGILRQITINDLPVGRSVEETLRLVQAFQFTDKHGEGEAAPWPTPTPVINALDLGSTLVLQGEGLIRKPPRFVLDGDDKAVLQFKGWVSPFQR